jgi:hypothetical protein
MKFQLMEKDSVGNKTGTHRIGAKRYCAGEVMESNDPLDTLFRNKFVKVPDSTPVSPGITLKVPGQKKVKPVSALGTAEVLVGERGEKVPSPLPESKAQEEDPLLRYGVDVTDEFPDALLTRPPIRVFHNAKEKRFIAVTSDGKVVKKTVGEKAMCKFLQDRRG